MRKKVKSVKKPSTQATSSSSQIQNQENSGHQAPIMVLPHDVFQLIFSFLNTSELPNAIRVCQAWRYILNSDFLKFKIYQTCQNQTILLNYYATLIYSVFDKGDMNRRLAAAYKEQGINEHEEDKEERNRIKANLQQSVLSFLTEFPRELEVKLMVQFFKQFRHFRINMEKSFINRDSLPLLLYDWNKPLALKYTLEIFKKHPYKTNKLFGSRTFDEVKKAIPIYQDMKVMKSQPSSMSAILLDDIFAKSSKKIIAARRYAQILYNFFDNDYLEQEAKKIQSNPGQVKKIIEKSKISQGTLDSDSEDVLYIIKDAITDDMIKHFPKLSESMQIRMIKEFLILYPDFDIQIQGTVLGDITLPVLLMDCNQEHAMRYLLQIKPYDADYEGAMCTSLNRLIEQRKQQSASHSF